jgi:hypothetical protein
LSLAILTPSSFGRLSMKVLSNKGYVNRLTKQK